MNRSKFRKVLINEAACETVVTTRDFKDFDKVLIGIMAVFEKFVRSL